MTISKNAPALVRLTTLAMLAGAGAACNDDGSDPALDDGATNEQDPSEPPPQEEHELGVYQEPFRSQFHFSPPFGWMNDPNGLVFFEDEYHLFFQYNPYATSFGNIGWGHAVSPDLVHWDFLPVAIPPIGDNLIFSGSAVVDFDDTSGLCEVGGEFQPCLVAIYTTFRPIDGVSALQTQDVAHSTDRGRSWVRQLEPVIDRGLADFRDPKVFWHEDTSRWIQVVTLPPQRVIAIYGSPNLIEWELLSEIGPFGAVGGIWECPDLFQLPVDGDPENRRWVLKVDLNPGHVAGGSGGQYFLGDFDGVTFVPESPDDVLWVDHGPDFYCATTYANAADPQGRLFWLGWMNNWNYASEIPTDPWRGTMTLARTMELASTPEGPRLRQMPVEAIENLRTDELRVTAQTVEDADQALAELSLAEVDAFLSLVPEDGSVVELRLDQGDEVAAIVVRYETEQERLTVSRTEEGNAPVPGFAGTYEASVPLVDGRLDLRLLIDRNAVELFAADGRTVFTALQLPNEQSVRLRLASEGDVSDIDVVMYPLRSIWR